MKNPNGYGCIRKLSGKRRKPWAIIRTTGWTDEGKQQRVYLGYYRTRQEAVKALADYNDNPYDLEGFTFEEVYNKWSALKYPTISASGARGYSASYNNCERIRDRKIRSLTFEEVQSLIDRLPAPSAKRMKILFTQIFDFAERRNLISRNFAHLLETKPIAKSTLHLRFSDEELTVLWERSDNEYVAAILMMIYSGVRPGELLALETKNVHLDERYFEVTKGKNRNAIRKVPIHHQTLPFFERWYDKGKRYLITDKKGAPMDFANNHIKYNVKYFGQVLDALGLLYQDGKRHNPDDVRHTFTSLWAAQRLPELYRRKIQGHSGKSVGEEVYTHITIDELRAELDKLKTPCSPEK